MSRYKRSRSRKKSSSKRRSRRSGYKRRRKRRRRPVTTVPKKQLVELTYCADIKVPNIGETTAPYMFRLNSLFDPNYTATSGLPDHQPRGRDQWATLYRRYCVVGAKVKVEPLWAGGGTQGGEGTNTATTLYGYLDDDTDSDVYQVPEIVELGMKSTHKYLTTGSPSADVTSAPRKTSLYFNVSMKKFFGISKRTQIILPSGVGHGDFGTLESPVTAAMNSNPTSVCYLKLHCDQANANQRKPVLTSRVTIKFIAVLYDPIELARS